MSGGQIETSGEAAAFLGPAPNKVRIDETCTHEVKFTPSGSNDIFNSDAVDLVSLVAMDLLASKQFAAGSRCTSLEKYARFPVTKGCSGSST